MASADGDVEQLLVSRTATPITQLEPDLSDQATRKIHGEVTITWPYSSLSKRFAFLLAEPDFRLRREKGQVRIVLNGPSAEAVGDWELGGGDEVTLALDGVEWAKDEEPSRPPGSRLDWQLKFTGKVMLKAILGETQETKYIYLDQSAPTEPVEAPEPIQLAEIDTSIFDDEPLPEEAPASPPKAEYATPVFIKRSRSSYGPLFDLDLDDEIEDDGGRRGKGRKRPRYSVQNGRWRYREESESPEPEEVQDSPSPAPEQDGDAAMQDTPTQIEMTDGVCQTDETALLPPPKSAEMLIPKTLNTTEPSYASDDTALGLSDVATTDTDVQASPPKDEATLPEPQPSGQQQMALESTPGPSSSFGLAPGHSEFTRMEPNGRAGYGMSQAGPFTHRSTHPQMQASSLFGTGPAQSQPMFGQPSNNGAGFGDTGGSSVDSVRFGFGQQPRSTFGGMQFTPSQQPPQYYDAYHHSAFYPESQQPSDHVSFASYHSHGVPTQPAQYDHIPKTSTANVPLNQVTDHEVPLWPIGAQTLDRSHAVGYLSAPEELRSDSSIPVNSSPGMIPPAVEDGTRNRDAMREEGILSRPVFEQGVPRGALPHGREASADEDEDSMDSDEEADYDEDEKGDDYDMRNYDRVSDDDEEYEGAGEQLSDGAMLDEDGYELYDDEEDYDEENYEEDGYAAPDHYQQPSQLAPQPRAHQDPVIIDLLSDSDEDEAPQAPVPPQAHLERSQMVGIAKSESELEGDRSGDLAGNKTPQPVLPWQKLMEAGQKQNSEEFEEEYEEELGHDLDGKFDDTGSPSHHEQFSDDDGSSEYKNDGVAGEESEADEDEPESVGMRCDVESIEENITIDSVRSIAEVEEAATSSPPRPHDEVESGVEEGSEEGFQVVDVTIDTSDDTRRRNSQGDGMVENGEPQDNVAESFQTQPIELAGSFQTDSGNFSASFETQSQQPTEENYMAADRESPDSMAKSFQTQPLDVAASLQMDSGELSASFQTQTGDTTMVDVPEPSQVEASSREGCNEEDIAMDDAPQYQAIDEDQVSRSEKGGAEDDIGDSVMQLPQGVEAKPLHEGEEGSGQDDTAAEAQPEEDASEDKTFNGFSNDPEDAPPSPSISHNQEDQNALGVVGISMTTVSSHMETLVSDKQILTLETQETEVMHSQSFKMDEDRMSVADEKDPEVAETVAAPGEEFESDAEGNKDGRLASDDEAQVDDEKDLPLTEPEPQPSGDEVMAAPSPPRGQAEAELEDSVDETKEELVDAPSEVSEEDFHDASELPQTDEPIGMAHSDDRAGYVTADSQASESRETEGIGSPLSPRPRRKGRNHTEGASLRFATTTAASHGGQRALPGQSNIPRTTRSKTMTFQKAASPHDDKEDMSIQLARAALKSPSRGEAPAAFEDKEKADLVERLGNDMPECVPLKDLKSYLRSNLDFAVVATSHPTTPQRTKARQYVTSFTATDPSIAPDGVVEVSLFRAHKDFLPIVKPGDSILLRAFTVTAMPDKGFGLQTHPEDSSWAVFEADGEDAAPQIRGPPVELGEEETRYLVDLRAWYAALDECAKDKLAKAAGEIVDKGREGRGKGAR